MCHQSSHLSSPPRRCVTRCVTFVAALLVAPPTQMESKTCTCCKHECTDWKRLAPLLSSEVQCVHAAVSCREVYSVPDVPSARSQPLCDVTSARRCISHSHEPVPPCSGVDQAQRMVSAMQNMQREHFGTAAIHQRGAGVTHPVRPEGTCGS